VHAELAGEDGAGGLEFFDYGGVERGLEAGEDFAAGGGGGGLGVEKILDGDGDALEGAAVEAAGEVGVGGAGGGEGGVFGEGEEGI